MAVYLNLNASNSEKCENPRRKRAKVESNSNKIKKKMHYSDSKLKETKELLNGNVERNSKDCPISDLCFICKEKGDLINCIHDSCDKFYHVSCLNRSFLTKIDTHLCPRHMCVTCFNNNFKASQNSKGHMYKCKDCPLAFHSKDECFIPGSKIISEEYIICPNHFNPEEKRDSPRVMHLLFCVICMDVNNLIFCKKCPYAAHQQCLKDKSIDANNFICERCRSFKMSHYGDVVWVKIYNYRWWPAEILKSDLAPKDYKTKHFDGEFLVKFFGANEYYWTYTGRVYPFLYKNRSLDDYQDYYKKNNNDKYFINAIEEALKALQNKKQVKSLNPVNSDKPPPYKHIKTNKPIGDVQIHVGESSFMFCGCKKDDPNPCGYDALCLNRSMFTECQPEVCEAGELCQNQKMQKKENAHVEPFLTENRGWGLRCLEDIKKGHFVIEYVGDLIDEEECRRRIKAKQECGDTNFYFCTLDSERIIDAGPKGNFSRFLNHSCEPNCESQKWMANGDIRVGIFAKQDIPAGSELTFDYQMDFFAFDKLPCNCGSKRCSGLIGYKPKNNKISKNDIKDDDFTNSSIDKSVENVGSNVSTQNDSNTKDKGESTDLVEKTKPKRKYTLKKKEKALCYKCKKSGKLLLCNYKNCGKSYHARCLKPKIDIETDWACPWHFCRKCNAKAKYKCSFCTNSYCKKHVGDISLENSNFLCRKHALIENNC